MRVSVLGSTGVRQVCIMSPWLFNVYLNTLMKKLNIGMWRRGVRFQEEGSEWRLTGLLYADDLVLCGELGEDLRLIMERFIELCMRRDLKVNAGKA